MGNLDVLYSICIERHYEISLKWRWCWIIEISKWLDILQKHVFTNIWELNNVVENILEVLIEYQE